MLLVRLVWARKSFAYFFCLHKQYLLLYVRHGIQKRGLFCIIIRFRHLTMQTQGAHIASLLFSLSLYPLLTKGFVCNLYHKIFPPTLLCISIKVVMLYISVKKAEVNWSLCPFRWIPSFSFFLSLLLFIPFDQLKSNVCDAIACTSGVLLAQWKIVWYRS